MLQTLQTAVRASCEIACHLREIARDLRQDSQDIREQARIVRITAARVKAERRTREAAGAS